MFNKHRKLLYKQRTGEIDKFKQQQSIIPNIIHSLDASHLVTLINIAKKDNFGPIITIHDCFGTLPAYMAELEQRVRKEFILIYSNENFLEAFHKNILYTIESNNYKIITKFNGNKKIVLESGEILNLPKLPKLGELDLKNIVNATYMIT